MITEKEVAKVQDKQMKVKIRAHPQFNRDITGNVYKKRESFLKKPYGSLYTPYGRLLDAVQKPQSSLINAS